MSSTAREIKRATTSQRRNQKVTKKQQHKLQQQQIGKNVTLQNTVTETPKTTTITSTATTPTTHLSNSHCLNVGKDGTFLRPQHPNPCSILPSYENPPKVERSTSFSLKGKLSKFINSFTGSKENIAKTHHNNNNTNEIDENGLLPYKFTRSRSMILLRRSNRRSLIEPQLEQLSEEAEKCVNEFMAPASPPNNSIETISGEGNGLLPLHLPKSTSLGESPTLSQTPNRRQSVTSTFASSTPNETTKTAKQAPINADIQLGKGSSLSLAAGTGNGIPKLTIPPTFNPQLNFQKRRSNTIISSFRSTLASLAGGNEKKKEKMNPKWSASLQSLQAIDNMVRYENMSFIDYDKFNGYEKQREKRLSTLSLIDSGVKSEQQPLQAEQQQNKESLINAPLLYSSSPLEPLQQTVVRLRCRKPIKCNSTTPRGSITSAQNIVVDRSSYNFDADYEHNLDKLRNVYRDSLDSRKLEILNDLTRDICFSDQHITDVLNLEDGSVGRCRKGLHRQTSTGGILSEKKSLNTMIDVPDCLNATQFEAMKSLMNCNPKKKRLSVLSKEIIIDFNVDGTHGKKRLKDHERFYSILRDAIEEENQHTEENIRKCFQKVKKQHFHKECLQRKSNQIESKEIFFINMQKCLQKVK